MNKLNYSLSNFDIKKYLGNKALIIAYKQLDDIDDLEKYMNYKNINFLIILYEYEPNYGHWSCIIKNDIQNIFEFFDPYGTKPDYQLTDIPMKLRNQFGLEHPKVAILLFDSKRTVVYNNYKLQQMKDNVSTCGKWCVIRCCTYLLPIETFGLLFMQKRPSNNDKYLQMIWNNFTKNFQ